MDVMKEIPIPLRSKRVLQCRLYSSTLLALLVTLFPLCEVTAETITIGKGTGILWEGLPFSVTLQGPTGIALYPQYGLLSISSSSTTCLRDNRLQNIGGYPALALGKGNVGLVPRATGRATYFLYSGDWETLNATLGMPETQGRTSNGHVITNPVSGDYMWCIPPRMQSDAQFYNGTAQRTATIAGRWVLVGNGKQQSEEFTIPAMYAASFTNFTNLDRSENILPTSITLRISTLACTISTTTAINFGSVPRNSQAGAELALNTYPLTVSCSQEASNRINANINLQFRAISNLYENSPARLSLNQGGGYITGEISDGVTSSGTCSGTSGVRFDGTLNRLGNITATENTKFITKNVTWRLCSGGADLPSGAVNASAEMMVTFN